MSLQAKILKNTGVQVAGKLAGALFSFWTSAMLLRYLGPAGNGDYTAILAHLTLFAIVADFGLYIILVKRMATLTEEHEKDAHALFTLRIISGVIILGLGVAIAWLVPNYSPMIRYGILIASSFNFLMSMNQLLSVVFQKFLRSNWIAIGEVSAKLVLVAGIVTVVMLKLSLLWVMATIALSALCNFGINYFASRKFFKFKILIDWKRWKSILSEAWPLALNVLFTMVYFKGDSLILFFYRSAEEVGWYGAPYKLLEVLITFPAMFVGLTLPLLTAAWQRKDLESLKRGLQRSFDFLSVITMPIVAGGFVLAFPLTMLLGGPEYIPSVPVFRILIFAVGAIYFATLFTYMVVAVDKQRVMMYGYAAAAVIGLSAYFILIPRYGMFGAASVTVFTECLVLTISYLLVKRETQIRLRLHILFKSIFASAIMGAVVWFLSFAVEDTMASIWTKDVTSLPFVVVEVLLLVLIGSAIYLALIVLLRAITPQDLKELLKPKQVST